MTAIEDAVIQLIESQPVAFLGTVDRDGFPEIKGMFQPRDHTGIRELYFPTGLDTRRVAHLRQDPRAVVYVCDAARIEGVQLQGHAQVLTDRAAKERVWREGDALYYPGGIEDPNYCVLKITVFQGRRYSLAGSQDFLVS